MPALIVSLLALLLVLWLLGQPWLSARRRERLRERAFPAAWRKILRRRVPLLRRLPADLQIELRRQIQVFVAEKAFIGCDGLSVNDEMRVTIAAQACLLTLNRPGRHYPELREILVYPDSFVVEREHIDGIGVAHHARQVLAGESWERGQVVLSWYDTLEGAATPDDGQNVVIHEFAHQLDQETGAANGAPMLEKRAHYTRWSQVLGAEFRRLKGMIALQQVSLFSDYGATDPAEFFAVISEVYFEQPERMADEHPELYQQLALFYRLDPLNWTP